MSAAFNIIWVFGALVGAVVAFRTVRHALRTGIFRDKRANYVRSEDPVIFWFFTGIASLAAIIFPLAACFIVIKMVGDIQ